MILRVWIVMDISFKFIINVSTKLVGLKRHHFFILIHLWQIKIPMLMTEMMAMSISWPLKTACANLHLNIMKIRKIFSITRLDNISTKTTFNPHYCQCNQSKFASHTNYSLWKKHEDSNVIKKILIQKLLTILL